MREGVKPGAPYPVCIEQTLLANMIERCFKEEDIYTEEDQLARYLKQQKYFPYKLFSWEKFLFALQMCTYKRESGLLRFPSLTAYVGRGAGKNGYESFKDFCLLTPINGVKEYNVDIFAMSEEEAKTSFVDVYNVLEEHSLELSKYFYWNKEYIQNLKTKSVFKFNTSGVKTKDSRRPGAITFDEFHAYEKNALVTTSRTGLGKKPFPRETIISTNGYERGGPSDLEIEKCEDILHGRMPDNGKLPFICKLDKPDEADDPRMWHKANPSLRYFPNLLDEMHREYADYKLNPSGNSGFIVKRMNLPQTFDAESVTDWDNIIAANRELPDLTGCPCVAGIDYMKTTDFLTAGLLFKYKGVYCFITHSWVCKASLDLPRIKAPLDEWAEKGLLTFMDGPEISPSVPAEWLAKMGQKYQITSLGLDNFRYTLLIKALKEVGFDCDKGGANNIRLMKRVTEMRYVPVITSAFNNHHVIWGDNPLMNWYTNNTCLISDGDNQYYGKKEEKSRKTDGFKAFEIAVCASEGLRDCGEEEYTAADFGVYSYS